MSIYEGSEVAQSYAQGFSRGRSWGRHDDVFARALIPEQVLDARERAATALERSQRAFWLGTLRGYREALTAPERKGTG